MNAGPSLRSIRRGGAAPAPRQGQQIDLTAKEFALLTFLTQRSGEALCRAQVASTVWDIPSRLGQQRHRPGDAQVARENPAQEVQWFAEYLSLLTDHRELCLRVTGDAPRFRPIACRSGAP